MILLTIVLNLFPEMLEPDAPIKFILAVLEGAFLGLLVSTLITRVVA